MGYPCWSELSKRLPQDHVLHCPFQVVTVSLRLLPQKESPVRSQAPRRSQTVQLA